MERVKELQERLWYAQKTIEHGWSRAVLVHQLESDLYHRQGKAITNFEITLPPPQSDLAKQALKDPYLFDFLTLAEDAAEGELERGLVEHITKFLLELGVGFTFVGNQYHLEVEGEDFYLDLLFYHLRLRCFIVIDLKMAPFKPEFAGKMNFYLSAVDNLLRHSGDHPSLGLILCKTRKKLIAEYALRNTKTPIGVSEYKLTRAVPAELKSSLPTIEELEAELSQPVK
jgi:predicted nuclease of restriction endonuclease-like (RecB) superfamily